VLVCATGVAASDFEDGDSYTGVKLGLVGSGSVDLDSRAADQATSFTGGLFFDLPLGSRLSYGLSADFFSMSWDRENPPFPFEESGWLLDLGVTFKGNFMSESSAIGFRPGVGVGIGVLPRMEMANVASSNYLTLKAYLEIVYSSPGDLMFLFDVGVWHAPSGGDNAIDVQVGPLVFLRAGVMF
jgi:hypothetical protein